MSLKIVNKKIQITEPREPKVKTISIERLKRKIKDLNSDIAKKRAYVAEMVAEKQALKEVLESQLVVDLEAQIEADRLAKQEL